jgi:hypothetical protein|tara:strand:- start:35 stop:304 length:270 start_codon:yes stop_codon:yes gene_type:complete
MNKLEGTRDYCEDLLREVQLDSVYFGKNKGSIYWVEGAETWCYLCSDTTEWGQADELLANIDDNILLNYYNDNKEQIDEHIEYRKESEQ